MQILGVYNMESRPKNSWTRCATPSQHVPTILSRAEVQAVLHEMNGIRLLMARLLYGSG
jgi:hypothetical protein